MPPFHLEICQNWLAFLADLKKKHHQQKTTTITTQVVINIFKKNNLYTLISDCKSQQDYCWTRKEDMKKDFSVLIPPPLYTTMKAMAHSLLKEKITCAYNCSSKCFQVMH